MISTLLFLRRLNLIYHQINYSLGASVKQFNMKLGKRRLLQYCKDNPQIICLLWSTASNLKFYNIANKLTHLLARCANAAGLQQCCSEGGSVISL